MKMYFNILLTYILLLSCSNQAMEGENKGAEGKKESAEIKKPSFIDKWKEDFKVGVHSTKPWSPPEKVEMEQEWKHVPIKLLHYQYNVRMQQALDTDESK